MLSVVKMLLKGEVGGHAFDSHGNYIVDHGKSWKNHGIGFLNFCGNPVVGTCQLVPYAGYQLNSCQMSHISGICVWYMQPCKTKARLLSCIHLTESQSRFFKN